MAFSLLFFFASKARSYNADVKQSQCRSMPMASNVEGDQCQRRSMPMAINANGD
jgi:hypothetical protein